MLINGCATAALMIPPGVAAVALVRALGIGPGDARRLPATLVVAYAIAVAGAGVTAAFGVLGFGGLFAWGWAAALISLRLARRFGPPPAAADGFVLSELPVLDRAGLAAVCVVYGAAVAFVTDRPVYEYDALTYHLHFAAQWLLDGRISIIETPFGDAAPAYAPADGSLWFAWWMAPWRDFVGDVFDFRLNGLDALVKYAGLPFAILLAASIRLLALRLGGDGGRSLRPAWVVLLLPWVVTQSVMPGVDVMMGACLVATIAFAADYRQHPSPASAALAGLSLGLALGTKFLTLVYAAPIGAAIIAFVWRRANRRDVLLFTGAVVAFGAPWFLRNGIVAGNPLFPAQIEALGRVVFPGAYVREAMTRSVFHVPTASAALVVAGHAVGYAWVPVALIGAALALGLAVRRPEWRAVAWLAPAGFVWHFLAVPYSSQDRFLIAFVALALPALGFRPEDAKARRALDGLVGVCAAAALFGPSYRGTFAGTPVVGAGLLRGTGPGAALTLILSIATAWGLIELARLRKRRASPVLIAALSASIVVSILGAPIARFSTTGLRELPLAAYIELWRAKPAVVAYAGRNRPFHLAGRDGRTGVVSVPVDGRVDTPLHAVIAENRAAGVLDPLRDKDDWRGLATDREAWRKALSTLGVEYILFEALSIEERGYLRYDEDGFPVERSWARSDPAAFQALRSGSGYELYRVNRP